MESAMDIEQRTSTGMGQRTVNNEHWPRGAVYLHQESCPNQARN